nr:DUF5133 domain-containing protein [Streptomyces sp. NRRL F-5126]
MAHPTMLRHLVAQYETARAEHARHSTRQTARRLDDATYTLCVSTGTRSAADALAVAARRLAAAGGGTGAGPADTPGGLAAV